MKGNDFNRVQTQATMHTVNAALSKTLNKLRHQPLSSPVTKVRPSPLHADLASQPHAGTPARPYINYQAAAVAKGPLPTDLLTKRTFYSVATKNVPSTASTRTGPLLAQQPTASSRTEITSINPNYLSLSTPLSVPPKRAIITLHQFNAGTVNPSSTIEEYPLHGHGSKPASRKNSAAPPVPTVDQGYRSLPEVSASTQMESLVQANNNGLLHRFETTSAGILVCRIL